MSLKTMLDEELPLNRKERYFTGTVLPMIVCRDSFKYLHALLDLVGCREQLPIHPEPSSANILFFSEYSFVESIAGSARKRFSDPPRSKDTPDEILLIRTGDARVLIAIEAKMYDVPTAEALRRQLDRQYEVILTYLMRVLRLDAVYHVALLPEQLYADLQKQGFHYATITWEQLLATYAEILGDDYFLEVLRVALDFYEELVSAGSQRGKYCEVRLTGQEIYDGFRRGTFDKHVMGRVRGLDGPELRQDVASGKWQLAHAKLRDQLRPEALQQKLVHGCAVC